MLRCWPIARCRAPSSTPGRSSTNPCRDSATRWCRSSASPAPATAPTPRRHWPRRSLAATASSSCCCPTQERRPDAVCGSDRRRQPSARRSAAAVRVAPARFLDQPLDASTRCTSQPWSASQGNRRRGAAIDDAQAARRAGDSVSGASNSRHDAPVAGAPLRRTPRGKPPPGGGWGAGAPVSRPPTSRATGLACDVADPNRPRLDDALMPRNCSRGRPESSRTSSRRAQPSTNWRSRCVRWSLDDRAADRELVPGGRCRRWIEVDEQLIAGQRPARLVCRRAARSRARSRRDLRVGVRRPSAEKRAPPVLPAVADQSLIQVKLGGTRALPARLPRPPDDRPARLVLWRAGSPPTPLRAPPSSGAHRILRCTRYRRPDPRADAHQNTSASASHADEFEGVDALMILQESSHTLMSSANVARGTALAPLGLRARHETQQQRESVRRDHVSHLGGDSRPVAQVAMRSHQQRLKVSLPIAKNHREQRKEG